MLSDFLNGGWENLVDPETLALIKQYQGGLLDPGAGSDTAQPDVSNDMVTPGTQASGLSVLDDLGIPTYPGFEDVPRHELRVHRTITPDGQTISFMAPAGFDSTGIGGQPFTPPDQTPMLNVPGGTLLTGNDPQSVGFDPSQFVDPTSTPEDRQVPYNAGFLPNGTFQNSTNVENPNAGNPNVTGAGEFQRMAEAGANIPTGNFDPSQNFGRRASFTSQNSPGGTVGTSSYAPPVAPQAPTQATTGYQQWLDNLYNSVFPGGLF